MKLLILVYFLIKIFNKLFKKKQLHLNSTAPFKAPTEFKVINQTPDRLVLTWKDPDLIQLNGKISQYEVQCVHSIKTHNFVKKMLHKII